MTGRKKKTSGGSGYRRESGTVVEGKRRGAKTPPPRRPSYGHDGDQIVAHLKGHGVSAEVEYRFHPSRKWRFDVAIPEHKVAIEIEGGLWIKSRHRTSVGFLKDMEKYNEAAILGWRVIRCTPTNHSLLDVLAMLDRMGVLGDKE